MKLKEVTPNNGDVFYMGAGTVSFIDGFWYVGDQPVTEELFTILGELEIKNTVVDSTGTLVCMNQKYMAEVTVVKLDTGDDNLNVMVEFPSPRGKETTWLNSSILTLCSK